VFRKFTPLGVRAYAQGPAPTRSALTIRAFSPVELLLTDSTGRRLGHAADDIFEIPLGSYFRDFPLTDDDLGLDPSAGEGDGIKTAYIIQPQEGTYSLTVNGTGLGTYKLQVEVTAIDGSTTISELNGIANVGTSSTIQVAFSSAPGASLVVNLFATFDSTLADIRNSLQLGLITESEFAADLSNKIIKAQLDSGTERIGDLENFIHKVNDQAGKKIIGTASQALVQDANSLIARQ